MKKIFLVTLLALFAMTFLAGCGGRVYAPREGSAIWYYHPELPEAAKALEDAEKAGKDKVCPDEFWAAKCRMKEAYRAYWACRTEEGIAMAKEATAMAKALCPPPAACTLTASPAEIEKGKSSTLTFKTTGTVKSAMLDKEEVPVTGATKTVSPTVTTTYTGQCSGIGGTQEVTATVKVVSPPPPPPPPPAPKPELLPAPAPAPTPAPAPAPPKVPDKMTLRINFDFDKATISAADEAELKKAVDFVKKYPKSAVKIEGHTDSIGTDQYNQKLSERRAKAVAAYLVEKGACKQADISTAGYGESKPIADNKTSKGRFENRRAEILILEK